MNINKNNEKDNLSSKNKDKEEEEINNNIEKMSNDEKTNCNEEAISKEIRIINDVNEKPKNEENITNKNKKKYLINEEDLDNNSIQIGKKFMDSILLNLNSYWIEILGFLNIIISIIIYETIAIIILYLLVTLFKNEINFSEIRNAFSVIINDIGIKWLLFIIINKHLSVGFFCLITFSYTLQEVKNIKTFYILNFIKFILYYGVSIIILKVIMRDYIGGLIKSKVIETQILQKKKTFEIFEPLIDRAVIYVARFLSTFNIFLEKIILGSIYIFLFYEPKIISQTKILLFRLLSLIPILFILVSLILRALETTKKIRINEYISSFLLGPKISVYGYFITTLSILKYKSITYEVFDSEHCLDSRIFTKIGAKNFAIFGFIELIIGLFFPNWISVGIGNNYLLILSAPITAIYDYKRQSKTPFPCCKRGNFYLCFKIIVYGISCIIIFILTLFLIILLVNFISIYISPIIEFIIDNFDLIREIIKVFV